MPELLAALRQAAEAVRAQIPTGELTRASVECLLQAAEAACVAEARTSLAAENTTLPLESKRQMARRKWARIARQNASGSGDSLTAAE